GAGTLLRNACSEASGRALSRPELFAPPPLSDATPATGIRMSIDTELRTAPVRTQDSPPLAIRRVDAIPVALPLKKPMRMAGVEMTRALNVVVRIEAKDGTVGWGEAAS